MKCNWKYNNIKRSRNKHKKTISYFISLRCNHWSVVVTSRYFRSICIEDKRLIEIVNYVCSIHCETDWSRNNNQKWVYFLHTRCASIEKKKPPPLPLFHPNKLMRKLEWVDKVRNIRDHSAERNSIIMREKGKLNNSTNAEALRKRWRLLVLLAGCEEKRQKKSKTNRVNSK